MLIKVSELQVPQENPFQYDSFNRLENAEILTQFISTLDQPFVISIDSKWGSGKTTFIRMWKQFLENNMYTTVYFNAWENDISSDAFAALVGEIKKAINVAPDISKSAEIFENVKNITAKILKRSIPVAVKLGTAGLIDTSDFVKETVSSTAAEYIADSIDDYENRQEDIREFKQQLEEFAESLKTESNKPLVFFIDELDRCRPNFAIEILEKAKHLFSVPNIIFLISIDKKQLGNSIKAVYGNDFDTDEYLRRFIDLNYILPNPDINTFCNVLINRYQYIDFFEERTNQETRYDKQHFIDTTVALINSVGFSLRTIEQFFSQISIVLRTTPKNQLMFPILLVFMVIMKNHNPDLYMRLKLKNCTEKEIIDYLYSLDSNNLFLLKNYLGPLLEGYVFYATVNYLDYRNAESLIMTNYTNHLDKENIHKEDQRRIQVILQLIERLEWLAGSEILETLFKRIDISQRFE